MGFCSLTFNNNNVMIKKLFITLIKLFLILFIIITIILIFFNLYEFVDFADNEESSSFNQGEAFSSNEDDASSSSNQGESSSTNSSDKTDRAKEFEARMAKLMIAHMDNFLDNIREEIKNEENTDKDETEKEELKQVYYDQVDYLQEMNQLVNDMDKQLNIEENSNDTQPSESKRNAEEELEKDGKKKKGE